MKFDGHIKLTVAAIKKLKSDCPSLTEACNAPMFNRDLRIWIVDDEKSNMVDNISSFFVNYAGHYITPDFIYQVKLPDAVAFVDIDEYDSHKDPAGQRFHFMRTANETDATGYENACEFVKKHTEAWVQRAQWVMLSNPDPLSGAHWTETRRYVKSLAMALHSLQDSFSPGHTDRYFGATPTEQATAKVAPIRAIHVYAGDNKIDHSDHDYASGGSDSVVGQHAVGASADLMAMGILSIPHKGEGLLGWDSFKSKWLDHQFS